MQAHNLLNIQLGQHGHGHPQVHRQKVGTLGQPIHHHPDGVMSSKSLWQMGYKIHGDAVSFPHWYFQGL